MDQQKNWEFSMMTLRTIQLAALTLSAVSLCACGGGGSSTPRAPIQVTFAPALPTSIKVGTTASVTATVSNDPANGGVSWSVQCASSDCGSFNPVQTASGAASTYTPPATVPSNGTVSISATSVTDSTKHVSSAVTIAAAPSQVLADGTYVFELTGVDQSQGPYTLAGAF